MKFFKQIMIIGLGIFSALTAIFAANIKIEEQIVGPSFTPGVVYTLSPKGMHVATVHGRDGKTLVTVDGVDGPLMDSIFSGAAGDTVVKFSEDGFNVRTEHKWSGPVEFSPDGKRHAYAGQIGQESVVFLDGKEVFRGPISTFGPAVDNFQFSPDSKHLFFHNRTTNSSQSYRLVMDGRPVTPAFDGAVMPFFSSDGSRWGLLAGKSGMPHQKFLIIDGKDAGYVGEKPQFTPDGKRVVCIAGQRPKFTLLVDGKELVSGNYIEKVVISPTGDIGAVVVINADGRKKLFLNGKPAVDDAVDVVFSPDGKRMAAVCALNQKAWVILDGKKHKEYWPLENVAFTPDSSKCVYVASVGQTNYVVVNGQEDEGNRLIHYRPMYSLIGNSIAYTAGFMMGQLRVHNNDHVEPECLSIANLTLSPDGTRCVYYRRSADNTTRLIVNGEITGPSATVQGGKIFFSPDSKHFMAPLLHAFWCEDQRVVFPATPQGFTDDSQHLILRGRDADPNGVMLNTYYVNGDLVAKFSARGTTWAGLGFPKVWEQQSDGTIVFIGPDTGLVGGLGPIKRITVTPSPDSGVTVWVTNLKASEAKAAADVEAAQQKAIEDAAAAKQKAQEDAAAAAAKRKADYEAAVAAKKKAYEEAVAAKQKAREDALKLKTLNVQRARQGLPLLKELPDSP